MLSSRGEWRGVMAAHGADWHRPDLPGHGAAPPAAGDWLTAAAERAIAAMPPGPFDLLGHSVGACVALRVMADHPARVRRAVLVEPVLFAAAAPAARDAHRAEMAPFGAALAAGDRDGASALFHGLWGDVPLAGLPPPARAYMAERIHLVAATEPALFDDAGDILARLPDRPTTLVTSDRPAPVMAAILDGLAARLPRVATVRIPGAGHMIPVTHPAELAAALDRALA